MVWGCSRLFKLGGPSGWWDTIFTSVLQLMFYLVYFIVLPTRTAQFLPHTTTTAITFLNEGMVDYDRSIAGSFIVELFGWISWLQFSLFYACTFGVHHFVKSFFGAVAYLSDGYFRDITSPIICRANVRKLQSFNSTYGYDPFVAVDQRYLYFSGYMLFRTVSYLFSSNVQW